MDKLEIVVNKKTKDSITRTIRMSGKTYDKIATIAEEKEISFNNVVNQLIDYALNNLSE